MQYTAVQRYNTHILINDIFETRWIAYAAQEPNLNDITRSIFIVLLRSCAKGGTRCRKTEHDFFQFISHRTSNITFGSCNVTRCLRCTKLSNGSISFCLRTIFSMCIVFRVCIILCACRPRELLHIMIAYCTLPHIPMPALSISLHLNLFGHLLLRFAREAYM